MEENLYDEAETAWQDLISAASRLKEAANALKDSENSVDGYEIERALRKHRPELMAKHLEGLRQHRKDNRL